MDTFVRLSNVMKIDIITVTLILKTELPFDVKEFKIFLLLTHKNTFCAALHFLFVRNLVRYWSGLYADFYIIIWFGWIWWPWPEKLTHALGPLCHLYSSGSCYTSSWYYSYASHCRKNTSNWYFWSCAWWWPCTLDTKIPDFVFT